MFESRRLLLHDEFKEALGIKNIYFQPPTSIKMKYPCLVYKLDIPRMENADDRVYKKTWRFQLTYITKDPDDIMIDKILDHFSMISFSRNYVTDNLIHNIYNLYY